MTVKEVAKALGCSEEYIKHLCSSGVISHFVVTRSKFDPWNHRGPIHLKRIEIDPEEVEYIDWWLNGGGRKQYSKELYSLLRSGALDKKRYKVTTIIEEI